MSVLVLRHAGHTAEDYAWPVAEGDAPAVLSVQRGFQLARWTSHGMRHWLVSDLNPQEFALLLESLRSTE